MKISRTVATAVLAGALALSPAVAFAYGAEDYTNTGTASDTTPAVGESFTITVTGPANTAVVLTVTSNPTSLPDSAISIAGTRSLTKNTDAAGTAVFTVTLTQPGSYTAVVTDGVSGEVLSTQTFSVAATGPGASASAGGQLSATGSNALPIALGAGALLLAGAGGVVYAKKRRQAVKTV
ncbi:LPXTG cell wall anchor domain-containing protein [Cellulomonas dongxiuzhuiae]|uniref:LPXTG cell wall anchor domain-containing protein n=1 Tax=Cellulomonas dongxiuzhuiae TaxID=2819979 RepID=UPI001AAF715C|nr:LPXTG cell wall anchor domain-containing protein [Cellulomonas dongxiuzhuiae]MBO3088797.1 LPXTG cell wall anchor domain-containing protein [Cellulomonas dongxiuzhuiae]